MAYFINFYFLHNIKNMKELDDILTFIYKHINNNKIIIMSKDRHYDNNTTILSIKIVSFDEEDHSSSPQNGLYPKLVGGYYNTISDIMFIEKEKLIKYENSYYSISPTICIKDNKLFDKWFGILNDYYDNKIPKLLKESFGATLENCKMLGRDYKLANINI